MKKFIALFLVLSVLALSGNLFAEARRSAYHCHSKNRIRKGDLLFLQGFLFLIFNPGSFS